MRGLFAGFLMLTALDAVLSSTASASRVGGMFTGAIAVLDHILSPTVAAIPDLRHQAATAAPASSTTPASSPTMPKDWTTKPAPPSTIISI